VLNSTLRTSKCKNLYQALRVNTYVFQSAHVRWLQVLSFPFCVQNGQFISVSQPRRVGEDDRDTVAIRRTVFSARNSAAVAQPKHAECDSDTTADHATPHHSSLGNVNRLVLVPGNHSTAWQTSSTSALLRLRDQPVFVVLSYIWPSRYRLSRGINALRSECCSWGYISAHRCAAAALLHSLLLRS
jgi:hypothetical protein